MRHALTRTLGFRAEHHFGLPGLSAAENLARFGPVTQAHAHDFRCAVTVEGPLDEASGMLLDLAALDRLLAEEIGWLDGGDLNRDIPPFAAGQQPTCEALAAWFFGRIAPRLPAGTRLARVRVAEDATLAAECCAER